MSDAPLSPPSRRDDLDILSVFRIIWLGKHWIILACICAMGLAAYQALFMAKREYLATAILEFTPNDSQLLDLESLVTGNSTDSVSINTEVETIKSHELIRSLITTLDLNSYEEFNPALRARPAIDVKSFIRGILFPNREPPVLTEAEQRELEIRMTAEELADLISLQVANDTYLLRIQTRTSAPQLSADISNTLAEIYIQDQIDTNFQASQDAIDWLSGRARELESELLSMEDEVEALQAEAGVINQEVIEQLAYRTQEFQQRVAQIEETGAQLEDDLSILSMLKNGDLGKTALAQANDRTLDRLAQQLDEGLQGDPSARTALEARLDSLIQATRTRIDQGKKEAAALETTRDKLREEFEAKSALLQQINQLNRELDVTGNLYNTFLAGLQEVTVQAGLTRTNTRLMSHALPPRKPVAPRPLLSVTIAGAVAALIASVIVVLREGLRNRVRFAGDIESLTGTPIFGEIPKVPVRGRTKVMDFLMKSRTSHVSEAVRNLRTSIAMSDPDNPPQVIMLTSSLSGEGKTTVSLALAMNYRHLQKRVLLIEGDLRRMTLNNYFSGIAEASGVMDIIRGNTTFRDAVQKDERTGIDVLLAGTIGEDNSDVFETQEFRELLAVARTEYDVIIIDTPPVLIIPDARVLGNLADVLLFVIRWNKTRPAEVRNSLRSLKMANAKVDGLVLSQIDIRQQSRYGQAYDGGSYYMSYGKSQGYYS